MNTNLVVFFGLWQTCLDTNWAHGQSVNVVLCRHLFLGHTYSTLCNGSVDMGQTVCAVAFS